MDNNLHKRLHAYRRCFYCGKKVPNHVSFCSPTCKTKYYNKRKIKTLNTIKACKCHNCGITLGPKVVGGVFCCINCAKEYKDKQSKTSKKKRY